MAFGKRKTGGGETYPLLKFDGRVGRLYTQDRERQRNGEWQSVQNDVTDRFVAALDIGGIEHGYMRFLKGAAPEMVMVPMGEDIGEMPEGENWQEGLRLQVKMPGEDFRRTMTSSAIGLWRSSIGCMISMLSSPRRTRQGAGRRTTRRHGDQGAHDELYAILRHHRLDRSRRGAAAPTRGDWTTRSVLSVRDAPGRCDEHRPATLILREISVMQDDDGSYYDITAFVYRLPRDLGRR